MSAYSELNALRKKYPQYKAIMKFIEYVNEEMAEEDKLTESDAIQSLGIDYKMYKEQHDKMIQPRPGSYSGVVKFFDAKKGWGFIECSDPEIEIDVFVHFKDIVSCKSGTNFKTLREGEYVEFQISRGKDPNKKYQAKELIVMF